MRRYYKVTTTFDDNGKVRAFIGTVLAESKPAGTFQETKRCDVYEDFFETLSEAKEYVEDAYNA